MTQMQSYQARTRLYIEVETLSVGGTVQIEAGQAHYLRAVLRAQVGDRIEVFNGRDGAFASEVVVLNKTGAQLLIGEKVRAQESLPKLALAFAVVKKERVQMIIEKATELGAARIIPVITQRTQGQAVKQLKQEKLYRYMIEAAEQCGRTALPQLADIVPLTGLLETIEAPDQLLFADEMRAGEPAVWPQPQGWTTLLIGPEGGFSASEREILTARTNAHAITLGPRILRAETAALASLALWQTRFGDW